MNRLIRKSNFLSGRNCKYGQLSLIVKIILVWLISLFSPGVIIAAETALTTQLINIQPALQINPQLLTPQLNDLKIKPLVLNYAPYIPSLYLPETLVSPAPPGERLLAPAASKETDHECFP